MTKREADDSKSAKRQKVDGDVNPERVRALNDIEEKEGDDGPILYCKWDWHVRGAR